MIKTVVKFIATGGWSGFAPVVPGTIGTIPAWLIAWFFLADHWALLAAAVVVFFVSVWSAGRMESELGHDSKQIVIDEWAGMLVALLFLPHRLDVYIASFLFFRFYDVIKPYPSGRCEALPGGWGVTTDDLFAGLYANLTCWAAIIALQRLGWFGF